MLRGRPGRRLGQRPSDDNGTFSTKRLYRAMRKLKVCFVADQLWFMTRIREEEVSSNVQVSASVTVQGRSTSDW